jgi:hypothetical protein
MRDHARLALAGVAGSVVCVVALALFRGAAPPDPAHLARDADWSVMAGHQIAWPAGSGPPATGQAEPTPGASAP